MEAVAAVVTVSGLLYLTGKIISLCWKFRAVRGANEAAQRLINELEDFVNILETTQNLLADDEPQAREHHAAFMSWKKSETLKDFQKSLQQLEEKLQPHDGLQRAVQGAIMFPLRQKELEDELKHIRDLKPTLNFALSVHSIGIEMLVSMFLVALP